MRSSLVALALVVVCDCQSTPTQVRLIVRAEPDGTAATRAVELVVRGRADAASPWEAVFTQRVEADSLAWPIELALVPRDARSERHWSVAATAFDASDRVIGRVAAAGSYAAGAASRVELVFEDGCVDVAASCEPFQDCRAARCNAEGSDAGGPDAADAGAPDASTSDASPFDASPFDATPFDVGSPGTDAFEPRTRIECGPPVPDDAIVTGLVVDPIFSAGFRFEVTGAVRLRRAGVQVQADTVTAGVLSIARLTDIHDVPDRGDLTSPDVILRRPVGIPFSAVRSAVVAVDLDLPLAPGWYAVLLSSDARVLAVGAPAPASDGCVSTPVVDHPFSIRSDTHEGFDQLVTLAAFVELLP